MNITVRVVVLNIVPFDLPPKLYTANLWKQEKMQAALQRQFIQIQAALRVYNKFDREIAMVKIVRHHFHKFVRITFTSIAKHGFR